MVGLVGVKREIQGITYQEESDPRHTELEVAPVREEPGEQGQQGLGMAGRTVKT